MAPRSGDFMRTLQSIALLVLSVTWYAASAAPPPLTRDVPMQAMDAMDAADEARLQKVLSPTFVAIRGRGELVTREEFLSDLRSLKHTNRFAGLRRRWSDVKVRTEGDSATFIARSTWEPLNDQNKGRATGSALVTQHWRLIANEWQLGAHQTVWLPLPPDIRTFRSGELQLQGMLFTPATGQGPFPAIVYAHGNEPDPSDLCESVAPDLTSRGYVVWCPHRRGSGLSRDQGENLLRRLSEIEAREGVEARSRLAIEQLEGPHLADMAAAVSFAKTLPMVDARRVFMIGNSFGGVLTLLAAERDVGVAAVADFAGAALNWERSALFRDRLLRAARNARVPVFVAQASNDFSTAPTAELGKALAAADKPHRARIYPAFGLTRGEGHGFGVDGVNEWAAEVLPFLEAAVR
jgi:carboxymethylenebutenolidase